MSPRPAAASTREGVGEARRGLVRRFGELDGSGAEKGPVRFTSPRFEPVRRVVRMRAVLVTGPGTTEVVEVPMPSVGPEGVLVRMRACGICGSDGYYVARGGIPPREGATPIGHEPAGEVVDVGALVEGIRPGDHVVINPIAPGSGMIGSGGPQGALAEFLLVEEARLGRNLAIVPDEVPLDVAALNEPMAVARHAVNRTRVRPGDSVVVFGAGPIGLGATIGYKLSGAKSVVVADILPERLDKALAVGADAVINSAEEDVIARLTELHDRFEFSDVQKALETAATPGAADKVVVTFS